MERDHSKAQKIKGNVAKCSEEDFCENKLHSAQNE